MDSLLNLSLKRICIFAGALLLVLSLFTACSKEAGERTDADGIETSSSETGKDGDYISYFYPDEATFQQVTETYYMGIPVFYGARIEDQTLTVFGEYGALASGSDSFAFVSEVSEHRFPLSDGCPIRSGPGDAETISVEEFHDRLRDPNFEGRTLSFHAEDGVITEIRLES